ncbi:MAG: hypothetical protein HYX29_02865 [Solirubrobacterales bacterium]|nr:hypothetical protein [Solirubrobacterales bacterium]
MEIGSLEIILAVVAVFVVFGPKELPHRAKKPQAVKVKQVERVPLVQRMPSQHAAGRAPSPLQLRAAERPLRTPGQAASDERPQFAAGDRDGSPLPHELLRV